MDEVNLLKERIALLEIELSDSNNKLNLNRQYSDTLEEKIDMLSENNINYNGFYFVIIILLIFVIILYKKNLVLSKLNKS